MRNGSPKEERRARRKMYRAIENVSMPAKDFCGVYIITNTTNGKAYIGSSKHVMKRIRQHLWALSSGRHFNKHLQRAFDEYGAASFVVEDFIHCDEQERTTLEQKVLDSFDKKQLYNISDSTVVPHVKHLSMETRQKISEGLKKGIDRTQRAQQMRERWQNPTFRAKMLTVHIGKKYSPAKETIEKIRTTVKMQYVSGREPWNKGKKTPLEVRKKQSVARLGKTPANKGKKINKETRKYE